MASEILYSVLFCIYLGEDIRMYDWHGLNFTHRVTKNINLASRMVLDHLRYAYKSLREDRIWESKIKEEMEKTYLDYKDTREEWFDINIELPGDRYIEYHIRNAKWLEEI